MDGEQKIKLKEIKRIRKRIKTKFRIKKRKENKEIPPKIEKLNKWFCVQF